MSGPNERASERKKKKAEGARTAENIARLVLRAEYVRRDRARKVADTDVERHAYAALVLSREVVPEPVPAPVRTFFFGSERAEN